jgi:AAA ATPase domain
VKVTSIRAKNYKCHFDTGEIPFGGRFTVIVGQNSAGKTALLEALNPRTFRNLPHRTPQRGPFPQITNPKSEIEYAVSLAGRELEHAFLTVGGQFQIPVPHGTDLTAARSFLSDLFARSEVTFRLSHPAGAGWDSRYPSHALFDGAVNPTAVRLDVDANHQGWTANHISSGDSLPGFIWTPS